MGLRYVPNKMDVEGIGVFKFNTLSIDLRVLHHIIGRIFMLKIGRFDIVSRESLS